MFAGNYRDSTSKSECRDFKFMGNCMYTCNPCNLKSPQSDFHCNICREFDFTGILQGFPALDVGKPCNNLDFWRYTYMQNLQGFPVNFKLITYKVYIFFHCNIYMHVIPMIITCLLQGTLCDTEIPCTFYGGNICSVYLLPKQ